MAVTITNLTEYRTERDLKNARSAVINLAEDLLFKWITASELNAQLALIVKNPEITRGNIISLLEVNDHIFDSTVRFRIIDAYDFINIQKQTREKTDHFTEIGPELKFAA